MKYVNPDSYREYPRYEYITGYEVDGDVINIKYANKERKKSLENTPENIESVNNMIKEQLKRFRFDDESYDEMIKSYNHELLTGGLFCLGSYFCFWHLKSYDNFARTMFLLMLFGYIYNSFSKARYQEKEEILKSRFFYENEDLINYDIRKRFNEEEVNSNEEINLMTINDIENMTYTELKETVELIKQNYEPELKLKKLI